MLKETSSFEKREQETVASESLTETIERYLEEGSSELVEALADIKAKYGERMEKGKDLPEREKKLLILDCSGGVELGPLTVLSDQRLDSSNTDMFDVVSRDDFPDDFDRVAGIVITGSPSDIVEKEEKEWIKKTEHFVEKAMSRNIPILGVCFGNQMLADINGRKVIENEGGRSQGVYQVSVYRDEGMPKHPIFNGIEFQKDPDSDKESAVIDTVGSHAYRADYGLEEKKNLYGFHFTDELNAYPQVEIGESYVGLQFHPELGTVEGLNVMEAAVKKRAKDAIEQSTDKQKTLAEYNEILNDLREYRKKLEESSEPLDNVRFLQNFVDIAFEEDK